MIIQIDDLSVGLMRVEEILEVCQIPGIEVCISDIADLRLRSSIAAWNVTDANEILSKLEESLILIGSDCRRILQRANDLVSEGLLPDRSIEVACGESQDAVLMVTFYPKSYENAKTSVQFLTPDKVPSVFALERILYQEEHSVGFTLIEIQNDELHQIDNNQIFSPLALETTPIQK
jgi:hypothetical protein